MHRPRLRQNTFNRLRRFGRALKTPTFGYGLLLAAIVILSPLQAHASPFLTMKESIVETKPLVLDQLLKIPANFYAVTEWVPMALGKARNEVNSRRKHFNMTKSGFISQVRDETKTNKRDELIDESKQADVEDLGQCIKQLGDGQSMGDSRSR